MIAQPIALVWGVAAALGGVGQAAGLARARSRSLGALRLLFVTAILILAARHRQLPAATIGWMVGFAATGALLYRRLRKPRRQ